MASCSAEVFQTEKENGPCLARAQWLFTLRTCLCLFPCLESPCGCFPAKVLEPMWLSCCFLPWFMEPHGYSQTILFKCISFQQPLCPHQREAQAPVCASVPAAMKKPAATLKKPAVTQADEDQVHHCCCGTSWSSARIHRSHVEAGSLCARWPTDPLASCAISHGGNHSKWVEPSSMRIGWSSSCRRPLQLPRSLQP